MLAPGFLTDVVGLVMLIPPFVPLQWLVFDVTFIPVLRIARQHGTETWATEEPYNEDGLRSETDN